MGFKFIHAADIHLDSPLRGLSAYENAPAARLRNASRDALASLITRAIDEKVSFVVFAGDLYDGDWRDYRSGIFFGMQMGRLAKANIRAFVLYGNHDAESEMTKKLTLPDNVTIFSSRSAQVHKIDDLKVALHGRSFATQAVNENLAAEYKPKVKDYYNIGVLHTALQGYAAHANYAPCTLDELHAKGYDYWALGHVHEFEKWEEASIIVFPGNIQGRHIREIGRKGAVMVTVDDYGHSNVERLYLDVLRWELLKVDVGQSLSMEEVARKVGQGLTRLLENDNVPRAVRVLIEGQTRLHGTLFAGAAALRAEVIAQASAIDPEQLWIEKVKVATVPVEIPRHNNDSVEALAELEEILAEASVDADFIAQLQEQLNPFLNKASDELTEDVPFLTLARERRLATIIQQIAPSVLAQLSAKVN